MSDQVTTTPDTPVDGLPQSAPEPSGQPVDAGQSSALTIETLESMVSEMEKRVFERSQGYVDQRDREIRQRVESLEQSFDAQAKAGQPVSEEVKQALRQKAVTQGILKPPDTSPPNQRQQVQQPPSGQQTQDPVNKMVQTEEQAIQQEFGVQLTTADRAALYAKQYRTPFEYIQEVRTLLQSRTTPPEPGQAATPGASAPSLGSQKPAAEKQIQLNQQLEAAMAKKDHKETRRITAELAELLR